MASTLQPERWALLRVKEISNAKLDAPRTRIDVRFVSVKAPEESFWDKFYLTEKAISRVACFASRCGVEREVKSAKDVDVKLVAELLNKQVWAKLKIDEREGGKLSTDGWNFKSTAEPPEEESTIDYRAQDEIEIALENLE